MRTAGDSKISDIQALAQAARGCHACPLWEHATQTVFGEGSRHPDLMLIGEQPGDKEDLEGRPFVGPAGRVLREGLSEAGIAMDRLYITNAVKHFKWVPSGVRRLHKKPRRSEMDACRPWLEDEIRILQPIGIVCLGSTAAQSLLGPEFKLTEHRRKVLESSLAKVFTVTIHPSALLRIPEHGRRVEERRLFAEDLKFAAEQVALLRRAYVL